MPIEFLGDKAKKLPKKKVDLPPEMHKPEKELLKEAKKKEIKKTKKQERGLGYVNLADKFKYYFLKRRLTFIVLFVIIIAAGIYGYFQFLYQPEPPVVIVNNTNRPEPTPTPSPKLTPTPVIQPTPSVLPDTELAPIRGSVIKFKDEITLYLIEDNGELRYIDRETVVFDNGQSINDISFRLIYTISDEYKNIRQGKEVVGLVDWDPRVLSYQELAPFLD